MLLNNLGANLFVNMLRGKNVVRADKRKTISGETF